MGCHTWFQRPITKEERELLRSTVNIAVEEFMKPSDGWDPSKYAYLAESVLESAHNDTDFWIENGWFASDDFITKIGDILYVDLAKKSNDSKTLLNNPVYFHDVFRVKHYPYWIIHNKRELRRKMKKKYFELTDYQLNKISEFFNTYPGGIITFG